MDPSEAVGASPKKAQTAALAYRFWHFWQAIPTCQTGARQRSRKFKGGERLERLSFVILNLPERPMLSALIEKLGSFELLSEEAKARLRALPVRTVRFAPREIIVRETEPRGDVRILLEGVAARYKSIDDGSQAILGFLLPGDFDEVEAFIDLLDYSIFAISSCEVAQIPRLLFDQLLLDVPEVGRAFRRMARLDEAIRRVWLANMGQQSADKQAAHLLCELGVRFSAAGMGGAGWFTNPLTQEHLASVLGISPVHMNRVMHRLRDLNLIQLEGHVLRFPAPEKIKQYAGFDDSYLRGARHSVVEQK
jgi:CRP-like cAMP-binding protein